MATITPPIHLIKKRDRDDDRDVAFTPSGVSVPASASLREHCPAPYNQLALKSCSANAVSAALRILASRSHIELDPPSRLFLYYNSRVREGDAAQDNGATIRDALKAAAQPGICPESVWPYDPANVLTTPPQSAYASAQLKVLKYFRIAREMQHLKSCIAEGYPFLLGVQIYESTIESAQTTGRLILPAANDTPFGGHATLAVAYDDHTHILTALNSCGEHFGDNGYLLIPYAYLSDEKLTYDFWTIREISALEPH